MSDAPTTETTEAAAAAAPESPTPAPQPKKAKTSANNPYVWGTGRRKTAIARVRIRPGDGKFQVNKRDVDEYFRIDKDQAAVRTPLVVTDTVKSYDVFVNVGGGGITGQAGAVVLGLARALAAADPSHLPKLRAQQLLRRDPRKVERKKYGQPGARRRFQFSKR